MEGLGCPLWVEVGEAVELLLQAEVVLWVVLTFPGQAEEGVGEG